MATSFERRLAEVERLLPAPKPVIDKKAAVALYAGTLNEPFERPSERPRELITAAEASRRYEQILRDGRPRR